MKLHLQSRCLSRRKAKTGICAALMMFWLLPDRAFAQVITDTANGLLSASIPFANLTPGTSSSPASTQIQFRIRSNNATGYKIQASATFSAAASALLDGGRTVTA